MLKKKKTKQKKTRMNTTPSTPMYFVISLIKSSAILILRGGSRQIDRGGAINTFCALSCRIFRLEGEKMCFKCRGGFWGPPPVITLSEIDYENHW